MVRIKCNTFFLIIIKDPNNDKFRERCLKNEAEFRCYQILSKKSLNDYILVYGNNENEMAKIFASEDLRAI